MPTYTITFEQEETAAIYSLLEQIVLPKSDGKRIAHNIESKIENAPPDPEPEPEVPSTDPETVVE
jgi:hypothetical protein